MSMPKSIIMQALCILLVRLLECVFFFAEERYDYAKKLKTAIADLQKVGEKLGKFDVEKRQAVANEDYDKAKLKKVQMDEYRLQVYKQLEIHDLLELGGVSTSSSYAIT